MTSLSRHFCDQTLLRPDIALSKHCCAQTLVHPGADESRRCGVWSTGSNRHYFLTAIGELGELKTQLRPDADTLWAGLVTGQWPVNSPHKGTWRGTLMFSLICALNIRLRKQSWGWWFEMPSRSLWRHWNELIITRLSDLIYFTVGGWMLTFSCQYGAYFEETLPTMNCSIRSNE